MLDLEPRDPYGIRHLPPVRNLDSPLGIPDYKMTAMDRVRATEEIEIVEKYRQVEATKLLRAEPGSRSAKRSEKIIEGFNRDLARLAPYRTTLPHLEELRLSAAQVKRNQGPRDMKKGLGCLVVSGGLSLMGYLGSQPGERYYIFLWGDSILGVSSS